MTFFLVLSLRSLCLKGSETSSFLDLKRNLVELLPNDNNIVAPCDASDMYSHLVTEDEAGKASQLVCSFPGSCC